MRIAYIDGIYRRYRLYGLYAHRVELTRPLNRLAEVKNSSVSLICSSVRETRSWRLLRLSRLRRNVTLALRASFGDLGEERSKPKAKFNWG